MVRHPRRNPRLRRPPPRRRPHRPRHLRPARVRAIARRQPDLARAVEYVERTQREWTNQVDGTYVIGIRNHIWPLLPRERYAAALERDTRRLLNGADDRGTFSYRLSEPFTTERYDHSTTQYGVLGLWEAAKQDARVPISYWERVAEHFIKTQHADGGWSYSPTKETTKSMTCAGLTVLTIAQQQLGRNGKVPNPQLERAINRGLDAIDHMFEDDNTGILGGTGYYLYSVERVALATGRSRFGNANDGQGTDWFNAFADHITGRVLRPSDSVHDQLVNSAFFLLFLSRGDTPVFFNKLDLSGVQDWNNRPNDVYFLAKNLSNQFESELNFKTVGIDWEIERWLGAPLTYVSVATPLELTDTQIQTLKTYLDLGGLLFVNPERNTTRIRRSINEILDRMYPGAELANAGNDHPALNLWKTPRQKPQLLTYHNGVRDLVMMPTDDLGFDWQAGRNEEAYDLGANLFLYTTGYQRLDGRASVAFPQDPGNAARGPKLAVAVASPNADFEPGLWEAQRRWLGNAPRPASRSASNPRPAEIKPVAHLDIVRQPWEQAGQDVDAHGKSAPPDLLHLVGVEPAELSEDAVQRIVEFARQGGTVLIETVGGLGPFASSIEEQFVAKLDRPAERLSRYEPLFAAQPDANTYDLGRVTYRAFSLRNYNTDNKPRLVAFRVDDRLAIFISAEDLSLAAMGVRHWDIHGYSDDSARKLLVNLLLNEW